MTVQTKLVPFKTSDESSYVLVEVARSADGTSVPLSNPAARLLEGSEQSFESALQHARSLIQKAANELTALVTNTSEVSIEFGVGLDAKAGAVLATIGGSANLTVRLTIKNS